MDVGSRVAMYITFAITPIGLVLNSLCLLVFLKSRVARTPTGIHLVALALADNVILVALFLYKTEYWAKYTDWPNLRNYGYVLCTLPHYAAAGGLLWSGLLVASATIERFLSVAFPFRVKTWNLYKKSKSLMVVYFLIAAILCSYEFLCYSIVTPSGGEQECKYTTKYARECSVFDTLVSTVLSNGLCFSLILIFTILTCVVLHRARKTRENLGNTQETKVELQITVMLVVVAVLFLVLRIPEMLLYQLKRHFKAENIDNEMAQNVKDVYPMFMALVLVNHSVNFGIYVVFFKSFRRDFRNFFACCSRKRNLQTVSEGVDVARGSDSHVGGITSTGLDGARGSNGDVGGITNTGVDGDSGLTVSALGITASIRSELNQNGVA